MMELSRQPNVYNASRTLWADEVKKKKLVLLAQTGVPHVSPIGFHILLRFPRGLKPWESVLSPITSFEKSLSSEECRTASSLLQRLISF